MTNSSKVLRYKNRIRKPVRPGERVPLKLSNRQRELILKHTFADDELTAPLHVAPVSNNTSSTPSHWMIWKSCWAMLQPKSTTPRTRIWKRNWPARILL
jgi:hypothetical protein